MRGGHRFGGRFSTKAPDTSSRCIGPAQKTPRQQTPEPPACTCVCLHAARPLACPVPQPEFQRLRFQRWILNGTNASRIVHRRWRSQGACRMSAHPMEGDDRMPEPPSRPPRLRYAVMTLALLVLVASAAVVGGFLVAFPWPAAAELTSRRVI